MIVKDSDKDSDAVIYGSSRAVVVELPSAKLALVGHLQLDIPKQSEVYWQFHSAPVVSA